MTLTVKCEDIGFDCAGVVNSETEEELLTKVAEHAKSVHGVDEITDEIIDKVRSVIIKD